MHNAATARKTLEILWHNYLVLHEQVDFESMPPDVLDEHIKQKSPIGPYQLATWLCRFGFFISAWSLWESYARGVCGRLLHKRKKASKESTVAWVGRSLRANRKVFVDQSWFESANCVRNLVAHYGGKVADERAKGLFDRAQPAFSDLHCWQDKYLDIQHEHVADLQLKVEEFVDYVYDRVAASMEND